MKTMKKLLFVFALMLVSTSAFSQTVEKIFNEFKDKPGVQAVNLDKASLSMFAAASKNEKSKKMIDNIDAIKILHIEDNAKTCKQFAKKVDKLKTEGFETLVNVKEEDETSRIFTHSNGDIIDELIILHLEKDECTLLHVFGKINFSEIDNVIDLQNFGE